MGKLYPSDVRSEIIGTLDVDKNLKNKSHNYVNYIVSVFNKMSDEEKNEFFKESCYEVYKKTKDAIIQSFSAKSWETRSPNIRIPQINYSFKSLPTNIQIKLLNIFKEYIFPTVDEKNIPRESQIVDMDKLNVVISYIQK